MSSNFDIARRGLCLGLVLSVAGPSHLALAQSSAFSSSPPWGQIQSQALPKTLPPPRGTGLIVGGSAVLALVGAPSIVLSMMFSDMRKTADQMGSNIESELPDNPDFPMPSGIPDKQEIKGIRNNVDRTFRTLTNYFVISSIVGIVGGGTMLALGIGRQTRYGRWRRRQRNIFARHQIAPVFTKTPRATPTYGIAARF